MGYWRVLVLGRPYGDRVADVDFDEMTRNFRNFLWFSFGVLLSAVTLFAHAETQPATYTANTGSAVWGNWTEFPNIAPSATPLAACNLPYGGGFVSVDSSRRCWVSLPDGYSDHFVSPRCPSVGGQTPTPQGSGLSVTCSYSGGGYSCPSTGGWTLSGTNCTRPDCSAGQTRDDAGVCLNVCTLSANAQIGTGRYGFPTPQPSGVVFCVNGCAAYPGGNGTVQGGVSYQYAFVQGAGGSASSCTPGVANSYQPTAQTNSASTPASGANPCIEKGEGFGTVNGVVVCTGPTTTVNTTTKTDTTKRPDGSSGSTTTNTTTTCAGAGSCSTTTTTTVIGGGSGPGGQPNGTTTTNSQTNDPATMCQSDPTNPKCTTKQQEDYCNEHPDSVQCKDLGTPSEPGDNLGEKRIGVSSISVVDVPTLSGCPAPLTLPRQLGSISYQPACDFAGWIKPLVLAFAWLSAGLIVIGAVRNG